ncbi:MAG: hypothetical protein KA408_02275 [Flavobacteriales bacterium]|nr:hypothetical protein [Flavobacteriales bacterium]
MAAHKHWVLAEGHWIIWTPDRSWALAPLSARYVQNKMMRNISLIIFTLVSLTSIGQSIESITQKVTDKICECMSDSINVYSDIRPEFNRCYDKEFNFIFNIVNADEQKVLVQEGAIPKIKDGIVPLLNTSCEKVKTIIESDLAEAVDSSAASNAEPFPTNFTGKDINKLKKRDGEIVAFNGLVTQVQSAYKDKPYYQVKLEGGNTIWIASLVNSGYEIEGKILRILGYVSAVGDDPHAKEHSEAGYHILAFGVVDMETKQMAMMPGSELQIKEWMNGSIPKAQ